MTFVFRTRLNFFLLEFFLPFLGCVVLTALALYLEPRRLFVFAVIFAVVAARYITRVFLPFWNNRIIIDDEAFMCRIDGETYRIVWSDVLAAHLRESADYVYLHLGAEKDFPLVLLNNFDAPAVWSLVHSRVDAVALAPDAMLNVPSYQEWVETSAEIISQVKVPVSSRYFTAHRYLGLGFLIFAGAGITMAIRKGDSNAVSGGLIIFLFGLGLTMGAGEVTVSENDVLRKNPYGKYRIKWSEVEWIETGHIYEGMVFHGDGKRLVVPGSEQWSKKTRGVVVEYINAQIEQRQIPVESSVWAAFKTCKNTRVT